MLSATRLPATAFSACLPCTCTLRMRPRSPGGHELHRVVALGGAAPQRAGHDRARARDGEHAVHRQAQSGGSTGALSASAATSSSAASSSASPAPVRAETGTIGAPSIEVPRSNSRDLACDQLEPVGLGEVGLGDRNDAARDAEQVDDREVLARLRHDAVVGGDHEQHHVDAGGAGDHLAHEALVAGHVHHAHRRARSAARAARSRARW